jgi:hypothetical protein
LSLLVLLAACDQARLATPIVSGPTRFRPARPVTFEFRSIAGQFESTAYVLDWGDGTAHETTASRRVGEACPAAHIFADSGDYEVRALAWDGERESEWSSGYGVTVRSFRPGTPQRPAGPDTVAVSDTARFVSLCFHPLSERVAYQFDWGDTLGEYGPFVEPGSHYGANHAFGRPGEFAVRARARDSTGAESDWSDGTSVVVVPGRKP